MSQRARNRPELKVVPNNEPTTRSCFICKNVQMRTDSLGTATWCGVWDDPIDNEEFEARYCPEFTVDEDL